MLRNVSHFFTVQRRPRLYEVFATFLALLVHILALQGIIYIYSEYPYPALQLFLVAGYIVLRWLNARSLRRKELQEMGVLDV